MLLRLSLTEPFFGHSPFHWLSDIVEKLLDRKMTSTARPVVKNPPPLSSIRSSSEAVLHLDPFSDEFEVMCAIWAPLLPFGINSSRMISISDVCVCSVTFPSVKEQWGAETAASLALMFTATPNDLRRPDLLNKVESERVRMISVIEFAHQADVSNRFLRSGRRHVLWIVRA